MTLPNRLNHWADTIADKRFATFCHQDGETSLSWGQLRQQAWDWAQSLRDAGVTAGQAVLLFLPTGTDLPAALLGAQFLGAVPSIMAPPSPKQSPALYWAAHDSLFRAAKPAALVTTEQVAEQITQAGMKWPCPFLTRARPGAKTPPAPGAHGLALVQYSSGTTGLKKGVPLSHAAIEAQVRTYADSLEIGPGAVVANWLPLYHDMGLVTALLMPVIFGLEVVFLDPFAWAAQPESLLAAIERHRASHCWLPNFAFEHLLRHCPARYRLDSLRRVVNCAEPCRAGTMRRFAEHFAAAGLAPEALRCTYAMAESVFALTHTTDPPARLRTDPDALRREGRVVIADDRGGGEELVSCGPPLPGVGIKILGPKGDPLNDGEVGEITVSAPFLFDGYHHDPKRSTKVLRDGWLHTRDRGFLWQGQLYVLGRLDDMLIGNGRNVHAHELEYLASQVDGVIPGRCAAFAVDNADSGGTDLVVVVETQAPERDGPTIRRAVRQRIFDVLGLTVQRCLVVGPGWVAKTTSGKVSRDANRLKYLQHDPAPRMKS